MNEIETVGAEAALGGEDVSRPATGPERPWIYGLMIAPSAVVANGVIQGGVLAYLLSQQGIGSGVQSHLIFLLALPTSLYFLWSPITDFFIRRRTWLILGSLVAAVLMLAAFHQPHLAGRTSVALMLLGACGGQLVVSSCGGMMGAMRSESGRRTASSFYQAGGMGFGALAAWVLVWFSSRVSSGTLGWLAAAMIGLPALAALLAPEQDTFATDSFEATMSRVWREFKGTFFRWEAVPYTACMIFPIASGAAVGLLPGIAGQYHVSGDSVAWINGLAGGLLVAAGSGVMALVKVRARATVLYMIVALVNSATMSILWLGPVRPATYFLSVPLYLFTVGSGYAMFTAVLLEFLGDSGKSGSGRYSIINSLGNVPVLYMALADGWGGERWGGRGLGAAEFLIGGTGAAILLIYFLTWGRRTKQRAEAAA